MNGYSLGSVKAMNSTSVPRSIHPGYTSWRPPVGLLGVLFVLGLPIDSDIKRYLAIMLGMVGLSHSMKWPGYLLLVVCMFEKTLDSVGYLLFLLDDATGVFSKLSPLTNVGMQYIVLLLGLFLLYLFLIAVYFPFSLMLIYATELVLIKFAYLGRRMHRIVSTLLVVFIMVVVYSLPLPIASHISVFNSYAMHPLRLVAVAFYKKAFISKKLDMDSKNRECTISVTTNSPFFFKIEILPMGNHGLEFIIDTQHLALAWVGYRFSYYGSRTLAKPDDRNCFHSTAEVREHLPEILRDSELWLGMKIYFSGEQLEMEKKKKPVELFD